MDVPGKYPATRNIKTLIIMKQLQELPKVSRRFLPLLVGTLLVGLSSTNWAQDAVTADLEDQQSNTSTNAAGSEPSLAMKLQNPVASLISVPIQSNFDFGAGPNGDGFQYKVNIEPVIPVPLSEDWNLISRTIIPVVYQENVVNTDSQAGLSDLLQSVFFSPKAPGPGGIIWGAGPALLFPTATDDLLGTEKFGAGPSAVLLKQDKGWTYGGLVNHVWSYAGNDSRSSVNSTFLQPFVSYTTKKHTTVSLNTETSYDWSGDQWTVPVNLGVSQLVHLGKQPVSFQIGGRYYAEAPDNGPEWGLRFTVTLLFPE